MIRGDKPRNVLSYLQSPLGDEVYVRTYPAEGEQLIGIPYGYAESGSKPFIEHTRDGFVIMTVNTDFIVDIEFKKETPSK